MPITALTEAQKIFLDNYIRKHAFKGRKKLERAEGFSDLRQSVLDLMPNVPATGEGARFADRLKAIDARAAAGDFKVAREAARKLLGDMRTLQAGYAPDTDVAALQAMVADFLKDASEAAALYDGFRAGLRQMLPLSQPIADAAMPTAARGSADWKRVADPLIGARAPDVAALARELALREKELGKLAYFLRLAYEGASYGLDKQNRLAAEIVKSGASQGVRDLVAAQIGRVRVPAFAGLCEAGQPGKFLAEDAFVAREQANLRALAARLRTLKNQVDSLTADAGFGDAVADAPVGGDVARKVAQREAPANRAAGMSGHRRGPAPVDRVALQRDLLERMRERQRRMARRDADFDALEAEQQADRHVLATLGPQPGDLSLKTPPPAEYKLAGLAAALPSITGDRLPTGSPDTDYEPDAEALARLADASAQALQRHLASEGLTSLAGEAFFDLTLQSPRDFADAYCAAQHWAGPQLTAGRRKVAQAIGQALYARVRQLNAGKTTADQPAGNAIDPKQGQVLVGGKAYGQPKELARGGFGVVSRYESLDQPGAYVVVKSTIRGEPPAPPDDGPAEWAAYEEEAADRRDAMKREVKAHRHLMKAAAATQAPGSANIVGMKGAMAAEDGSLHMVLEIVDGGDLDDNRMAMMVAANAGALPEEARNILNQARIKQAVQGMIFMRDQDLVHFDIKGANFMVAGDGTVKVGDFGSAAVSAGGDGKIVAGSDNPGTGGYVPGQAAEGDVVDSAYDTFALGKVIQVAHLNATNPLQAKFKDELPPEFAQLTGALARVTQAMTQADAGERPRLEQVLESSYLKNLDGFDAHAIDELSRTAVEYSKALRREAAAVRAQVPAADLAQWAGEGKKPESLGFTDLVGPMQVVIGKAQAKALQLRAQLEALGPAPVVPPGAVSGQQRLQAALARHQAAAKKLEDGIAAELKIVKDKQALLALFGQSDDAKQLAARLRDLSNRLLRPSEAGQHDQPPALDAQQAARMMHDFTERLSAMLPAIARAKQGLPASSADFTRLASEAGTLARRHRFTEANQMLDDLQGRVGA